MSVASRSSAIRTGLSKSAGIAVAVVLLIFYAPAAWSGFLPHGTTGSDFEGSGVVASVVPGGPAERAGIRTGDRLLIDQMPWNLGFAVLNDQLAPKTRVELRINTTAGDRSVRLVTAVAPPAPLLEALLQVGAYLATAVALVVAAGVMALRPGAMAWWLLLYAGGTVGASGIVFAYSSLPQPLGDAFDVTVLALIGGAASFPILPFVLRFPYDRPDGKRLALYRASVALTCVAVVGFFLYYASIVVGDGSGHHTMYSDTTLYTTIFSTIPVPLAIAALLYTYFHTGPRERERLKWGIFGMSFAFAAYAASSIAFLHNVTLSNALELLTVVLPLSLAYAIVRHRLIDFGFAANRAIAYSVTTALILGLVKAIDAVSSWLLNQFHLALLFQAVASLTLGFVISRLHRTLGTVVDRTLFRKRLEADKRLRRVAGAMAYATTPEAIDDMLVRDPVEALSLTTGAVFRYDGALGRYVRTAAEGWSLDDARTIDADDRLALMLRSEQDVIRLEDVRWDRLDIPSGTFAPVIAVPVRFRRDVSGFALFGTHTNGTTIDPDEQRLIVLLAENAGTAYGLADAVQARRRVAELESHLGRSATAGAPG